MYWITSNLVTLIQNYLIYNHGPGKKVPVHLIRKRLAHKLSRVEKKQEPFAKDGDRSKGEVKNRQVGRGKGEDERRKQEFYAESVQAVNKAARSLGMSPDWTTWVLDGSSGIGMERCPYFCSRS